MNFDELFEQEIEKLIVYLGKPPGGLDNYITIARKVGGEILIKPVEEVLLLGENDEVYIILTRDIKKGLAVILEEINIREVDVNEQQAYEYDKGEFIPLY